MIQKIVIRIKIYLIKKQYKITMTKSFPVAFPHLWLETHFSPFLIMEEE